MGGPCMLLRGTDIAFNSLVIAATLDAGSSTLYTEDMQDGQIIETLTIRNPFHGMRSG